MNQHFNSRKRISRKLKFTEGGGKLLAIAISAYLLLGISASVQAADGVVVLGGLGNTASGSYSSVSGGLKNTASESFSSVSGGQTNTASGNSSSVSGGAGNTASGSCSSVSGGSSNTASGSSSFVSGGLENSAIRDFSSVSGGFHNTASGNVSSVFGGNQNTASGYYSSVCGGSGNKASGEDSSVFGGFLSTASGKLSSVSGGYYSKALGTYSWAAGGATAYGKRSNAIGNGAVNTYIGATDTADKSMALGYMATADEANTISFGHDTGDISGYTVKWQQTDGKDDYTKAPTLTPTYYSFAAYNRLVKIADGIDAHDAVTVGQLNSMIANFHSDIDYDDADKSSVSFKGSHGTRLTNLMEGAITATSTDAVIGSQLANTESKINGIRTSIDANTTNITKLTETINANQEAINSASSMVNTLADNRVNTNLSNLTVQGQNKLKNLVQEEIANYMKTQGQTEGTTTAANLAVSDAFVHPINDGETKANADLSNLTDQGKSTIRNLSKESVKVINGTNTTVTVGKDGDASTFAVNVSDEAIQNAVKPQLDKKLNLDGSNLDADSLAKLSEKLGTGSVASDDKGLVNGGTVYEYVKKYAASSELIHVSDDASGNSVLHIGGSSPAAKIDVSGKDSAGKSTSRVITGVSTDANDATSAANVSYVNSMYQMSAANDENIIRSMKSMEGRMNQNINKVGAGAAALAALSYDDIQEGQKWQIAAGIGNYENKTAYALGAKYHVNRDISFHVGATLGNTRMVNGGFSIALGHAAPKVAPAYKEEFESLKQAVAVLAKQNQILAEKLNALGADSTKNDSSTDGTPDVSVTQ